MIRTIYFFNERDAYVFFLCIFPLTFGHMLTIWAHYFRAERVYQNAISKVTEPSHKKQNLWSSLWDRRLWGYTGHFWVAVFVLLSLNIVWFTVTMTNGTSDLIEMLNRNSGVSFFWATLHVTTKLLGYHWAPDSKVAFAFDYTGRGMQNTMGLIAYISLAFLATAALPWMRRRYFSVHISVHRVCITLFFVCMTLHYPEPMVWYYILPSFILFLLDRFVPKIIQARTIHPEATCAYNADCDIIRIDFTSSQPMKPYYPGDYITVQVPSISTLYHPFTVASYWAEDPCVMTLFLRVHHMSRLSWTSKLAKLCNQADGPLRIRANIDGVFGDRRHGYLRSDVIILFIAGTSITTFMSLIKAIAAQTGTAPNEPPRIQVHLVGTFRTRSELHAYGSFLHQITRDPRFTKWLHVHLYVSRPDKAATLAGPHAYVVQSDVSLTGAADVRRTSVGTCTTLQNNDLKEEIPDTPLDLRVVGATSGVTAPHAATASSSSHIAFTPSSHLPPLTNEKTRVEEHGPHSSSSVKRITTYDDCSLPTFVDANSTALAKRLAAVDLTISIVLVTIPLAVFYGFRAVQWEGSSNECETFAGGSNVGVAKCLWTYAFLPGFLHIVTMTALGYMALWVARRGQRTGFASQQQNGVNDGQYDSEANMKTLQAAHKHAGVDRGRDGNWDEGEVAYSRGRMNIRKHIDEFVAAGIGHKTADSDGGLVSVFAGGPEGFVDMVEHHVRQASWTVDFHRETWSP
ncbi:hypothetical protein BGW42_005775 [Actinomortierella wolfii]|nr:hypothetical protein BGW42_005775 [Actinomortierella wolfii]